MSNTRQIRTIRPVRAWWVSDYEGEYEEIRFAQTAGQAKEGSLARENYSFIEIRATRAPSFDDMVGKTITARDYHERGWWCRCWLCDSRVDNDTEEVENLYNDSGGVYCSPECKKRDNPEIDSMPLVQSSTVAA